LILNIKPSRPSFGFGSICYPNLRKKSSGTTNTTLPKPIFTLQHGENVMGIRYVKGNLLEAPEQIVLHGCNACGVMGSGVAKLIREKWPKAYRDYRDVYDSNGLSLGSIVQSKQPDGKIIFNAITQSTYGKSGVHVSYWAVANIIRTMSNMVVVQKNQVVAMPMIGAGLGGGNWSVISAIIENEAKNYQVVVYIL
jgi:O-acetyl-ADP-ribose deacetylase (regulator of RNase III)